MNKYISLSTLILILTAGLFLVSCDNDNSDSSIPPLTEDQIANDSFLSADPSGGVVLTFLEHPDDSDSENDTGDSGVDIVPIRYSDTATHTFCWEDSNA